MLDYFAFQTIAAATIARDLPDHVLVDCRLRHDDPMRANVLSRRISDNTYTSHVLAIEPCHVPAGETTCDGQCVGAAHTTGRGSDYFRTMLVWGRYGLDAADGEILTRTR